MKKSIILILSISLLLQLTTAVPLAKRETKDVAITPAPNEVTSSSNNAHLHSRYELLLHLGLNVKGFLGYEISRGIELLTNVVDDLKALPDKSEELQANIKRMDKFLKEHTAIDLVEYDKNMKPLFPVLEALNELLKSYEHLPEGSKLKAQLKQALHKNGYEEFETDLKNQMKWAITSSFDAFEGYVGKASEAEKKKITKAIEWLNKYKAEKDEQKQLGMLDGLFAAISSSIYEIFKE